MRGISPPRSLFTRGGAKPISEILGELLQGAAFTRRTANAEIVAAWEAVVGQEVSKHARVAALRKNVLHIEVDSASWLHELAGFHRSTILAELRQRVKGSFIKDLKFRQCGARAAGGRSQTQEEA